jgi:hypothetical protein
MSMPVTRAPRRGHRLAEDATAAADVDHALALEACTLGDVAEPQRVDLVQRLEVPGRIPPPVGQRLEAGDFRGIDVLVPCFSHRSLLQSVHAMRRHAP